MTNPDGALWEPWPMLPVWLVHPRGLPDAGVFVAALTRGQAVSCAMRSTALYSGWPYTDMRARAAEDPWYGGWLEWASEGSAVLRNADGSPVRSEAELMAMAAEATQRALYGRMGAKAGVMRDGE